MKQRVTIVFVSEEGGAPEARAVWSLADVPNPKVQFAEYLYRLELGDPTQNRLVEGDIMLKRVVKLVEVEVDDGF